MNREFFNEKKRGDRIPAADWNRLTRTVSGLSGGGLSPGEIQSFVYNLTLSQLGQHFKIAKVIDEESSSSAGSSGGGGGFGPKVYKAEICWFNQDATEFEPIDPPDEIKVLSPFRELFEGDLIAVLWHSQAAHYICIESFGEDDPSSSSNVLEVVTDVRCEGGELIVCTRRLSLPRGTVIDPEECPDTESSSS